MTTVIEQLQEACDYAPDKEGDLDDLIDYKDALQDLVERFEEQLVEAAAAARKYVDENDVPGEWLDASGLWKDWESEAEAREAEAIADTYEKVLALLRGEEAISC